MATVNVLVHFVGLAVFMSGPSTTTTNPTLRQSQLSQAATRPAAVKVILPRVGGGELSLRHLHPATSNARVSQTASTTTTSSLALIPQHTALIAFKTSALDQNSMKGWTFKNDVHPLYGEFSYIELNGEHISFQADKQGRRIALSNSLPHITMEVGAQGPNPNIALVPGYQPPDYSDAAAVVELGSGELNPCQSILENVRGRIDTEVKFANDGTGDDGLGVVVTGRINTDVKQFTIRADTKPADPNPPQALIVIVNAPLTYEQTLTGYDANHYFVYCSMLNGGNGCVPPGLPQSILDRTGACDDGTEIVVVPDKGDHPSTLRLVPKVPGRKVPNVPAGAPRPAAPGKVQTASNAQSGPDPFLLTFECSNSQYP